VITITSPDMSAEFLEEYRKNHNHIFRDLNIPPDVA